MSMNTWIRGQASKNHLTDASANDRIREVALRSTVSVPASAPRHPGMNNAIRQAAGYPVPKEES